MRGKIGAQNNNNIAEEWTTSCHSSRMTEGRTEGGRQLEGAGARDQNSREVTRELPTREGAWHDLGGECDQLWELA